jgi:hypothetical protein
VNEPKKRANAETATSIVFPDSTHATSSMQQWKPNALLRKPEPNAANCAIFPIIFFRTREECLQTGVPRVGERSFKSLAIGGQRNAPESNKKMDT